MTTDSMATDHPLLRELVAGLSPPGATPALSVGIVGSRAYDPQPPAHCLRTCLAGDPGAVSTKGCAFLRAAGRNQVDPAALDNGVCPQGFHAAAQTTFAAGDSATLVTVEGAGAPDATPTPTAKPLHEQLDRAARLLERIDALLAENAGFANEVLQSYEQLNLIFDLTQQVSQFTDVRGIERLLMQRLTELLGLQSVYLATTDGQFRRFGRSRQARQAQRAVPALERRDVNGIIDTVRITRQTQVIPLPDRQVLAAPLMRLDNKVDVALAVRWAGEDPFNSCDMQLVESVLTFGGQIINNTALHEQVRRMSLEVTRAMIAAIDKKDHYTSGHSERGGFLTRLTAQEMGVPPSELQSMEWAGLLHDVGKIGIPEAVLCKHGKLTDEEFEIIKQHPRMGYEILKPIASFETVLDGVLYHHEYPDGSGYPEGRQGADIPLVARIIHVVDTFDALTSTRSYRKAFTHEKAMQIIREEMGKKIDVQAAEAFFRAYERYRCEDPDDFAKRLLDHLEPEDDAH